MSTFYINQFVKKAESKNLTPQIVVEYANPIVDYVRSNLEEQTTIAEVQSLFAHCDNAKQIARAKQQLAKIGGQVFLLEVQDEYNLEGNFRIISKTEIKL